MLVGMGWQARLQLLANRLAMFDLQMCLTAGRDQVDV